MRAMTPAAREIKRTGEVWGRVGRRGLAIDWNCGSHLPDRLGPFAGSSGRGEVAGFKRASRAARSSREGREGVTGSCLPSPDSAPMGSAEKGGIEKFGGASSLGGGGGGITGSAVVSSSGPRAKPVESSGLERGAGGGSSGST